MTDPTPRALPFDPRALTAPVDDAAARSWADAYRAANRVNGAPVGTIVGVVVAVILILPLLLGAAFFAPLHPRVAGTVAIGAVVLIGVVIAIAIPAGRHARRVQNRHWYRMASFARANGLEYLPRVTAPQLPGMIFGIGDNRHTDDALRASTPRFVEFGDYSYSTTTSNGKTTTTTVHPWGYIAVRLTAPLPNIVLDAVGNNGLLGSNLPRRPDTDQRLSLEGDFDRYFSLYCPSGYEADALYLFTPDVMARFVDNAALLDVEIVDDWLLLYHQGGFRTESPEVWAWLFGVVGVLLDRVDRWGRWRDDRLAAGTGAPVGSPGVTAPAAAPDAGHPSLPFVAPPTPVPVAGLAARPLGVAPPGQRLRPRFPAGAIIAIALVPVAVVGLVVVTLVLMHAGVS